MKRIVGTMRMVIRELRMRAKMRRAMTKMRVRAKPTIRVRVKATTTRVRVKAMTTRVMRVKATIRLPLPRRSRQQTKRNHHLKA